MRPAARIYRGHVMHMRLRPKRHYLRMAVFSLLLDIDRIDETLRPLRLLHRDKWGLFSVHTKDHGARDGSDLRAWVDSELARAGEAPAQRVEMLSFPRMLGYGFNPLTVYYCYGKDEALQSLIYEVKNTFGEQIAYVLPAGEAEGGAYRQVQAKEMYVSPFIDLDQTYRFAVQPPGDRLALRIRQAGKEGHVLIATLTGRASALSDAALLGVFFTYPLMTIFIIAQIHWHALRLFLKGVPFLRQSALEAARERAPAE